MNVKRKVLILVAVLVFLTSVTVLIINFLPKDDNFEEYKKVVVTDKESQSITETQEETFENPIDFEKLNQENNEVIAWIQIPNTVIDYPILQSGAGTVEDFYLNKGLDKKRTSSGSIYIQKINSPNFTDQNTVIYGHNMRNGSMFGSLKKFKAADFFNQNDTLYIYTNNKIQRYKIYSAFVYDDRHILSDFDFSKTEDYQKFIDITFNPNTTVKNVREGVEVTTDDKIITLSTCTNVDTERYLVVAVLEEEIN